MTPLDVLRLRLELGKVKARHAAMSDAYDMLHGVWEPDEGEILPLTIPQSERARAYERVQAQMQGDGPTILEAKLGAIVGGVTWGKPEGGGERKLDARLNDLDLEGMAALYAEDAIARGIAAGLAHISDTTGEPTITRLGGYIEPYVDPADRDRIVGLFQTDTFKDAKGNLRYWVRIYDFEQPGAASIRIWESLENPQHLAGVPDRVIENAPVPRWYLSSGLTRAGQVVSEGITGAPLIRARWASEARLTAAEEIAAIPMLVGSGVIDLSDIYPGAAHEVEPGGSLDWLSTEGVLAELRAQCDKRQSAIDRHFSMPGGNIGNSNQMPAAETVKEANRRALQSASRYAAGLGRLLTRLVEDYCALARLSPAPVVVRPDPEFYSDQRIEMLTKAKALGAVPPAVLAREVQLLIGDHYSDAELAAFLAQPKPEPPPPTEGGDDVEKGDADAER